MLKSKVVSVIKAYVLAIKKKSLFTLEQITGDTLSLSTILKFVDIR